MMVCNDYVHLGYWKTQENWSNLQFNTVALLNFWLDNFLALQTKHSERHLNFAKKNFQVFPIILLSIIFFSIISFFQNHMFRSKLWRTRTCFRRRRNSSWARRSTRSRAPSCRHSRVTSVPFLVRSFCLSV
jgi:hypothetical protein